MANYVICWEDEFREKIWEIWSGEDAMQERIDEITKSGILSDDIVVGEIVSE